MECVQPYRFLYVPPVKDRGGGVEDDPWHKMMHNTVVLAPGIRTTSIRADNHVVIRRLYAP